MSSSDDLGRSRSFRFAKALKQIDFSKSVAGISIANALYAVLLIAVLTYLLLPVVFTMIVSFDTSTLFTFPPSGFTFDWYRDIFSTDAWVRSFLVSFQYSILATAIAVILSSSAAYAIGRFDFRFQGLFNASTFLPLMIPQIILGLSLLLYFSRVGLVGNLLGFSLALAVYATPYATQTILAAMSNFDHSVEEAAMNLGADEIQTFVRVTFPMLLPGLLTAAIFAFVVSYSNLQIAVFLQSADLNPIPVRIFAEVQFGASPVIAAVATINIAIVLLAIVITERLTGAAEALGYT